MIENQEVHAFLGLVGHYRRFIKGFAHIAQPVSEYLTGKGASRKLGQVLLAEEAMEAFKALKWSCMMASILAFVEYTKLFLLETDASKDGLGAVLSQKQGPYISWEELSLNQTRVSIIEVGSYGTLQEVLVLPDIHGEDG